MDMPSFLSVLLPFVSALSAAVVLYAMSIVLIDVRLAKRAAWAAWAALIAFLILYGVTGTMPTTVRYVLVFLCSGLATVALTASLEHIKAREKQNALPSAAAVAPQPIPPALNAQSYNDDLRVRVQDFTSHLRQFGVQMQIKKNQQSNRRTAAMKSVRTPGNNLSPMEDKAGTDMWQKQNDIDQNENLQMEADFTNRFRSLAIGYRTALLSALQKEGKIYIEDRSDMPTKWTQDFINDNRFMGDWTINNMADYYERLNSML